MTRAPRNRSSVGPSNAEAPGASAGGPISNITRVAENAGAVVMWVNGLAHEVDAVSFATRGPVIALTASGDLPAVCAWAWRTNSDISHCTSVCLPATA